MATARAAVAAEPWRRRRVLPGFGLTLGFTLSYLTLIVLIPLLVLFIQAAGVGWTKLWAELANPRTLAAFRVSFGAAFIAALVNAVFGVLIAWVLVRYRFPGRRFVDALIDLPFGLPTAVAGIALTSLYATTGWIGRPLSGLDLRIAFTPLGILIALVFVGLPFVVRTVEPVLREREREHEEAAALLGASRFHILRRVILPPLLPAVLTGFTLAFARHRRVRVGDLHRRQHAWIHGDHASAHRHQARAVRLRRRDRDRRADADRVFRSSLRDQPPAGVDAEAARWLSRRPPPSSGPCPSRACDCR